MTGLGIILLIVVFFWLFWPMISRWLKRKAMERAEDYMRSTMGMPPRDKTKKRGETYNRQTEQNHYYHQRRRKNPFQNTGREEEPLIPKEYAEDVEFVETKDYSSTTTASSSENGKRKEIYHESQISDVEWVEIKNKK